MTNSWLLARGLGPGGGSPRRLAPATVGQGALMSDDPEAPDTEPVEEQDDPIEEDPSRNPPEELDRLRGA